MKMMDILENKIIFCDMEDIYRRDIHWESLKGQTVLVTGATGMLASYIVYFLLYLNEKHQYHIQILAQLRHITKANKLFGLYLGKKYFHIIQEDICKPFHGLESVDYIIHAASLASPKYYENMPIEVALPNAVGTYYLLEYAAKAGCKGFLYFSSGDVYGKLESGIDIHEDTFGSVDPLDGHSCYSESKRMGETWCMAFAKEKRVSAKIARIAHTYGPTMDIDKDPRVFASFLKNVFYGEDIVMYSDGMAKRPFCYIADAVAGFFTILLMGKSGEAYNVCNTKEFLSMNELAQILVGLKPKLQLKVIYKERDSKDMYLENRANLSNKTVADKLKGLGWAIHFDTRQGFGNTLEYLEQTHRMCGCS